MNRCLLVAATAEEISPFLSMYDREGKALDILITGVGMVSTAFSMGRKLAQSRYDFALNVGIAGAISKEMTLGEVVYVEEDCLAELGAEDDDSFLTIEDLGFGKSVFRAISGEKNDLKNQLKKVTGITVNKVHGNERSISAIKGRLSAHIESMEGAAFYYACEQFELPCAQVRSISNYVEKRNKENWKIGLAVKNLNDWLIENMDQWLN
ncbi:futalosine hydrolase [Olivibacter domesticus]|uniref:Futalosine hydrolase n=1 Tax=Olivibacter domesticus TaxID=407022 RepID=A0A1H7S540_OLID1|nr:futalosine hydrolase [Olivibacter domesticus]SEL67376.1 futalosine hydrolase [Olivibacter domesticus]